MKMEYQDYTDSNGLTSKQESFANAVAYEAKGYSDAYRSVYNCESMSPKTINNRAYELSQNGEIAGRISQLKARIQKENRLTHEKITERLSQIAFGHIGDLYGDDNKLIHPSKMTLAQSIMVKRFDEVFTQVEDSNGEVVTSVLSKVEFQDVLKALDMLARHIGYYEQDYKQESQMTKTWDELEEIHQRLMAEMRAGEKRIEGRGQRIELALSQGIDLDDLDEYAHPKEV